jgi:hypothetical protein
MIKKPIILLLLSSLGVASPLAATKQSVLHQWLVQPKACIVQKLGDSCAIAVDITVPRLRKGNYCFFQDDTLLICFSYDAPVEQLNIEFNKDTLLSLRNQEDLTLYSQKLEIKTRETKRKVRRVRDPWSLF